MGHWHYPTLQPNMPAAACQQSIKATAPTHYGVLQHSHLTAVHSARPWRTSEPSILQLPTLRSSLSCRQATQDFLQSVQGLHTSLGTKNAGTEAIKKTQLVTKLLEAQQDNPARQGLLSPHTMETCSSQTNRQSCGRDGHTTQLYRSYPSTCPASLVLMEAA